MKSFKWLYVILGLIIIIIVFFALKKPDNSEKNKTTEKRKAIVEAYIVKQGTLTDEISVSGSLQAFEEVELKTEVSGRVVKINLPEGKFVKEGTLLVKLYDDDLQANLKKLQTQLAIQQQIYDRQSELMNVNGISKNDYEQTWLQLNSLKAEIEVQKVMIRKTEVLAPFDGVIGLRNISTGAQVTPSTMLATIRTDDKLKLDFSVPEKYGYEITPGMDVTFTVHDNDETFNAKVIGTERGIDLATRNLKVRAIVNSRSPQLIPGSYANVELKLKEINNAVMIPTQAIIPQGQAKKVFTARNRKAHFVTIKTGIRKDNDVEVIEGLTPGDTLITTGIMFLKEGSELNYSSVKTN